MAPEASSDVYYDPYDVDINADPYPTFKRLRDEAPAYYNEKYDLWAVSRHEDVERAFVEWESFSSDRGDVASYEWIAALTLVFVALFQAILGLCSLSIPLLLMTPRVMIAG